MKTGIENLIPKIAILTKWSEWSFAYQLGIRRVIVPLKDSPTDLCCSFYWGIKIEIIQGTEKESCNEDLSVLSNNVCIFHLKLTITGVKRVVFWELFGDITVCPVGTFTFMKECYHIQAHNLKYFYLFVHLVVVSLEREWSFVVGFLSATQLHQIKTSNFDLWWWLILWWYQKTQQNLCIQ